MTDLGSPIARRASGERGAVLIFAALGLVIAILSAALAIDVGSVIWRKRDLQVVVDLAAGDAAQALAALPSFNQTDAQLFAENSADRNDFDFAAAGNSLVAELGTFDATLDPAFVPVLDPALADAVRVTARRQVGFNFVPGSNTVTVGAVASFGGEPTAGFSIGSSLASLSPQVTNPVLTRLLGTSTPVNLDLVGYQGLASSSVSFRQLADADATLGTPEELLTSTVSVRRLAQASAAALNNKGDAASVAAANGLLSFASEIDTSLFVAVDDLVVVQQPGGGAAVEAQFNVFQLLTGSALVANGTNTIAVPGLTAGIAGLQSDLEIRVIEAPQFAVVGPARFDTAAGQWVTRASTAQVQLKLNTRFQREKLNLLGLLEARIDLTLPITVDAAKAVGSLTDIRCAVPESSSQIDILVNRAASDAQTSYTAEVTTASVAATTSSDVASFQIPGGSETLTFLGPHDGSDMQTSGGTSLGLATELANDIGINLDLLGLLSVDVFNGLVLDVTDDIDTKIFDPLFDTLGLSIAGADVRTTSVDCPSSGGRLVQ